MWSDYLYGARNMIDNCAKLVVDREWEEEFKATKDPIIVCTGPLTDVSKVAEYAKRIYILAGSFNPSNPSLLIPPNKVKKNKFASSNAYSDPLAAQIVLEKAREKAIWLFESGALAIYITPELLQRTIDTTHNCNEMSMCILRKMYKTMIENDMMYDAQDPSLIILTVKPELFSDISIQKVVYDTETMLDVVLNQQEGTVTDILTFSLGIGAMYRRENGTPTVIVENADYEKVKDVFFEILCRDDFIYACCEESSDECSSECSEISCEEQFECFCEISCEKLCQESCRKPCDNQCEKPCQESCRKPCDNQCEEPCQESCRKPCNNSCKC